MLWILGGLAALWLVLWLTRRGARSPEVEAHAFTREEIAGYDRALPKYLLVAATSLLLAGLHALIVQLPGVRNWLFLIGEPASLLVDEVSQQLLVVGGVVMLSMGLTCYALPRLTGRPLRNHGLARVSFLLTFAGTVFTALLTASIGLLQGLYTHGGASYSEAQARLGYWGTFPLQLFRGARDAGYCTFALLVILSVYSSRPVLWPRHRRRLTYWLAVPAVAFLLVAGQRILQQLPGNPLSLRGAGEAAILINYQAYTHLHLYAGALVPIAAATFTYLLERRAERRTDWQRAGRILGLLGLSALAFYLARLGVGLYESYVASHYPAQPGTLAPWRGPLLALSGLAALIALLSYAAYTIGLARAAASYLPRAIVGTLIVSLILASLAALHGAVLSLLPVGQPDAVSHAHGTLILGAALLLPALTLADSLLIDAAGAGPTASLAQAGLGFLGGGIVLAYLAQFGLGGPAAPLVAAGLQLAGFLTFALHTYQATRGYQRGLRERLHFLRPRDAAHSPLALLELPMSQVLLIEFLGALAGFPGFGWLFAGLTLPGALLLYAGPAVAWALLPSLFTLSQGWLYRLDWSALLLYLPASALASTLALRRTLKRQEVVEAETEGTEELRGREAGN